VSTDCKLEAEPVPFGNKLPVVISSASALVVRSKNAINHFIFSFSFWVQEGNLLIL
jgi:hypothetical protein